MSQSDPPVERPPTIGPFVLTAVAGGETTITYPPPEPGDHAVAGVALCFATLAPTVSVRVPAINLSAEFGSFVYPTGAEGAAALAVLAFDDATPRNVSLPSVEAIISGDLPTATVEAIRGAVAAFLAAELMPERIQACDDSVVPVHFPLLPSS